MAQTTLDQRMLGTTDQSTALTDHTITASDILTFADVGDSNLTKKDTVQGVLDLASGGALTYVSSITINGDGGTPEFKNLTSYDTYFIRYERMVGSTSAIDRIVLSDDNGSSYETSGYAYAGTVYASNGGSSVPASRSDSQIDLSYTYAGSKWMSGQLWLQRKGVSATGAMIHAMNFQYEEASGHETGRLISGRLDTGTIVNAIKIYRSSGDYNSGQLYLYGVSQS
mgnify:CR=1 FL=1